PRSRCRRPAAARTTSRDDAPHGSRRGRLTAFRRWGDVVVRHPLPLCLGVLAVTALLGLGALRLRLSIREEDQLPQSHPYVQIYNRINDTFGGGAAVVVGVIPHSGGVFPPATLGQGARLTAALGQDAGRPGRGIESGVGSVETSRNSA